MTLERAQCFMESFERFEALYSSALYNPELSHCIIGILHNAVGDFTKMRVDDDVDNIFKAINQMCLQVEADEIILGDMEFSEYPPFMDGMPPPMEEGMPPPMGEGMPQLEPDPMMLCAQNNMKACLMFAGSNITSDIKTYISGNGQITEYRLCK